MLEIEKIPLKISGNEDTLSTWALDSDPMNLSLLVVSRLKNMKSLRLSSECTLFDDPSVREKVTVMDKWDAMMDDGRNLATHDWLDRVEEFLELGKTYRVTLKIEEVS